MALNFIRSNSDYKRWQDAVALTKERKAQRNPDSENYDPSLKPIENVFAYANWLYHNVLSESGSIIVQESEIPGLIMSEEHNSLFEEIKTQVFNYKPLDCFSESKKWQIIESVFKKCLKNNTKSNEKILDEFIDTQSGYIPGNNNIAGLYGFGGYRDEAPIGPIVYGLNNQTLGIQPNSIKNGEPAVVEIEPKVSNYHPLDYQLDNLGNVVTDVEQSQKQQQLDTSIDGPTGDILSIMQELGYDIESIQNMDDEELQNVMIKALKKYQKDMEDQDIETGINKGKTVAQQLSEAFIYEEEILDERSGPISKAREMLAKKHRIKKATEKNENKYTLNQDEITKLMSKYGYKFNKDKNIWIKKANPTYLARKLLFTKFQQNKILDKDKDNTYIIPQTEVLKLLSDKGYVWNELKHEWIKTTDQSLKVASPETIQPDKIIKPQEPMVSHLPVNPTETSEEPKLDTSEKIDDPVEDDDTDVETDNTPVLSPLTDSSIISKLKIMQARFIMGIAHNKHKMTNFNDTDEAKNIPEIKDEQVLESIITSGYEWNNEKLLWLNHSLSLPKEIFDANENTKTLIARSYLAAVDKIKNIKINKNGLPSTDPEKLDHKMEIEGFIWNNEFQKWTFISEDEHPEPLNESVDLQEQSKEKFSEPKRPYKVQDVLDTQAKMLYRALQLEYFRKKYGSTSTSQQMTAWNAKFKDGGPNDPINGKLDLSKAEEALEKLGYSPNDSDEEPMWTQSGSNDIPSILKLYKMDKQEYIARGILGIKDPKQISIKSQYGTNPTFNEPKNKILRRAKDNDLQWNDDWGWIKSDEGTILSKNEKEKQNWLSQREQIPFESLGKEKQTYKEKSGYRLAARVSGLKPADWDNLSDSERKQAMRKLELTHKFDTENKQWIRRDKPVDNKLFSRMGGMLGKLVKSGGAKLGKWALGKAWDATKAIATDPSLTYSTLKK